MNRAWLRLVAGVLAVLGGVLAGCKKDSGGGAGGSPPAVRLGYFANLTHAQAALAVHSGELQQALGPIPVQSRIFNAGPSLIEALFAQQIDIGYVGPGPAISAFGKGGSKNIKILAGAAANGVLIVARGDSGINTLADLKGRKIATPQLGNTQDISARHYLLKQLQQPDANNVIPVANAEQVGMMLRKDIDAAWAPEPWGTRLLAEAGAKLIAEEKELWPQKEVTLTVVVVRPEFLARHPEIVAKVLGVHRNWTSRLQKEPQKHVPELEAALFKLTGKKLPEGVLAKSIERVKFTDDPLEQTLTTMARWTHELGFARQETNLEGLVDLTILKKMGESH